jgi:FkbM family methyltransferase
MGVTDYDPKDRFNYRQRKIWAEGILLGVAGMLKPGDVTIDCGANVGLVTELLAQTGADVYAFEPDPYAYKLLSKTVEPYENVTLTNAAVGVQAGSISLIRTAEFDENPEIATTGSTIMAGKGNSEQEGENTVKVELIDFIDYLEKLVAKHGHIAFMKMDIEGAELDILEAMEERNLFEHIGCSLVETHQSKFSELRPRFRAIRAAVKAKYPLRKIDLDYI